MRDPWLPHHLLLSCVGLSLGLGLGCADPSDTGADETDEIDETDETDTSDTSTPREPGVEELLGCTMSAGSHLDLCPEGADCPISTDTEIRCADTFGATSGLRVGLTPRDVVLVTAGTDNGWLFSAEDDYRNIETLPLQGFGHAVPILAQHPSGDIALASYDGEYSVEQGQPIGRLALFTRSTEGQWLEELVTADYAPAQLRDFEYDAQGGAHLWFAPDLAPLVHAHSEQPGAWEFEVVGSSPDAIHGGLGTDQQPVFFDYGASEPWALTVHDASGATTIGMPWSTPLRGTQLLAPGPLLPADQPEWAYVEVMGGVVGSSEGAQVELPALEGDSPASCDAQAPDSNCELAPNCTELGYERGAVAGARAADGSVWVAWVDHQLEREYSFVEECLQYCYCESKLVSERSTAELHLARVEGELLDERMTLEVEPIDKSGLGYDAEVVRALDMRVVDDRLAIGMRTQQADSPLAMLRLLEVDLAAL